MRICNNCGNKLNDEEKKCLICKTSAKNAIPVDENDKERIEEIIASVRAKGNNQNQQKKKPNGCLTIIIVFVVLGIIGAALGGGNDNSNQQSVNASNPINGESVPVNSEPKQEKKPDLELLSAEPLSEQYVNYIAGTIKNNTNKEYSYVQVEINLYKGETLIGSTLANVNNLGAGETWQFKAVVLEDEADSFKIKDITGF